MTELIQFDEQIFHLINTQWQNGFFDFLLPLLRNKYIWAPLYVFIFSLVLVNNSKNGWIWAVMLVLCVAISDTMSSQVLKKNVKRLRPCKTEHLKEKVVTRVKCGSGYSFPSSHATNHFAVALFLILTLGRHFKWIKLPLLLWAGSISYSQIYVGVHYPVDVLGGMLLGLLIAWLTASVYHKLVRSKGWELFPSG